MPTYQNPHPPPIMKAYHKLSQKVYSKPAFQLLPPSSSTLLKRRRAPHVSALIAATRERAQSTDASSSSSKSAETQMPPPPKARLRGDGFWMKTRTQVSRQLSLPRSSSRSQKSRSGSGAAPGHNTAQKGVKGKTRVKQGERGVVDPVQARYKSELVTHHGCQAPSKAEQERALARMFREQAKVDVAERARRRREEEGDSYFCFE